MTPEQLKSSILQAAIQGKLVNQNDADSSVEDLLAKIKEEKQIRINNGSIKKEKPLPDISNDNSPFDIPDTWKWVYCRDVMRFINGRAYKKPELLNSGKYPVLRVGNFYTNDSWYYSDLELEEDKYCKNGDLLYSWSASFGPKIWDGEKVIYHYHIWKLDYFQPMDIKYLYYYLLADTIRIKNSSHGLGFVFVTKEFMEARPIPIPPLEEQHRIVAKIEELLPFVDRYAASYEKLEQFNAKFPEDMKKSILQYAIQGKLVEQRPEEGTADALLEEIRKEKEQLIADGKAKSSKKLAPISDIEKPFDIPDSWKWVYLQDVSTINGGYAFKSTDYTTEGTRVIRISDFNEEGFVDNKIVRHPYKEEFEPFLLNEKDILLCMTGGTVGKSYFVRSVNEPMMTNQRVATIKILGSIQEYINYVILSPITQNVIQASKTSTNDNISMDTINSFLIPLPPFNEAKRIVAKIEELLLYCDRLVKRC